MPKRIHKSIGFKAFYDTDADIIAFIDGMDDGQKSDVMRAALRGFMAGQSLYQAAPEPSPLDEIRQMLADIQAQMKNGVVAIQAPAAVVEIQEKRLSDDEANLRLQKVKKNKW